MSAWNDRLSRSADGDRGRLVTMAFSVCVCVGGGSRVLHCPPQTVRCYSKALWDFSLGTQMFKMKDVFLKKKTWGCWEIIQKIKNTSFCWWWWWWRRWWGGTEHTHGLHRRPSCSLWLVDSAASLSAVDVKQSRRLGLTWPPSGVHLLTPPLTSSRLFVYFQKVSVPPVPCCSLYVGSFGCWFGFFLRWRRWWWICFALAFWMHIVFLLKPYSSLWDFEGFAHAATWIWFLTKCYSAQKSWKRTFSIGFDNEWTLNTLDHSPQMTV